MGVKGEGGTVNGEKEAWFWCCRYGFAPKLAVLVRGLEDWNGDVTQDGKPGPIVVGEGRKGGRWDDDDEEGFDRKNPASDAECGSENVILCSGASDEEFLMGSE